jgi:putative DNA primase/helicase
MDVIEKFRSTMHSQGISINAPIIPDGKLHRFHIEGDQAWSKNGWYVLFIDGIPAGAYGCWKRDASLTWCARPHSYMTPLERLQLNDKMIRAIEERALEAQRARSRATTKAKWIWFNSKTAINHPYLGLKKINPFFARQMGESLILPIVDFDGEIQSIQFIQPSGQKSLLAGGAKKGNFIPFLKPLKPARIMITEGFATGASVAQSHSNAFVLAAVDAGNIKEVAIKARKYFPKKEIVICADDDRLSVGNPGLRHGKLAAKAARGICISPTWPANAPLTLTDFNDLACWYTSQENAHG